MRVLPRKFFPILFGLGNLGWGVINIIETKLLLLYTFIPGPIQLWGSAFALLGLSTLLARNSIDKLGKIAVAAVMLWLAWIVFIVWARIHYPSQISDRSTWVFLWIAVSHYALSPYNRSFPAE